MHSTYRRGEETRRRDYTNACVLSKAKRLMTIIIDRQVDKRNFCDATNSDDVYTFYLLFDKVTILDRKVLKCNSNSLWKSFR